MTCKRIAAAVVFGALLSSVPIAFSQSESATVSGRVTDESGAVVGGTAVQLQSLERGTVRDTTSNQAGIYSFPGVQPGQYHMTIRKQGFRQVELTGLVVNVQDHIEKNVQLQVGSITESVTVTGGAPLINTDDGTVSTIVDRQFAENLPLNGRSFQALIQLTPGVVVTPSNSNDGGQFSVNGQRSESNYWTVDGVSANIGITSGLLVGNGFAGALGSFSVLGGTNSLVSVDAMQEFRVQTSTFAPEFGRMPGGQISINTRSGTNQYHGTAFDYLRNDVLDANNWFNGFTNSPPLPKAKERQNDFGGTFSGPILKDRTFFFFSYEGLRLRLPQTTLTTVPCDSTCAISGNVRAAAPPGVRPLLNAFPLPNGADHGDGTADFNASYSNPATLNAYSMRIDHKLNDKLSLFARYNYSPSELVQRGAGATLNTLTSSRIKTQTATLGGTLVFSSTTANDLRFNYSRTNASSHLDIDNFGGAVPLSSLPLPSPFTSENADFSVQVESLVNNGSFYSIGPAARNIQRQIDIVDNLSSQEGSHSLKFGVDFRRLSPLSDPTSYGLNVFFLDTAGDLDGAIVRSTRSTALLFKNLGIFGQDTWRIGPRLTITYGLRWDVDFAPSSTSGPNLLAVTGYNLENLANLALAPAGTLPFKTRYGNIAPRIGLAYQVSENQNWQTVLRGGFGVYYDLATSQAGNAFNPAVYPFGSLNFLSGSFPLAPAAVAPPPIVPPNASNGQPLFAFDPHLRLPYTLEWNVAVEQALGKQQTISASYIGSAGRRLLQAATINSPNPNLAQAVLYGNTATSDYDALQLQFQRRMSRGLQVLASYTWSHSIDEGSAGSTGITNANLINSGRGPSAFDIRHAFSAALTYVIPAPNINAFTNAILHGWSLDNIIQARSAPPVDVSDQSFFSFSTGFAGDVRPDLVAGQPLYLFGSQFPGGKALNPAAFTDPPLLDPTNPFSPPLRQGSLGRNALRGFGATQWDFAVHRDFPIRESLKLQFRAELFNVLNHPNFGPPSGAFLSPQHGGPSGFGVATQMLGQSLNAGFSGNLGGGAFDPLYQLGGPRSVQFGL